MTLQPAHPLLTLMIGDLKIKCDFAENGFQEVTSLRELASHLSVVSLHLLEKCKYASESSA